MNADNTITVTLLTGGAEALPPGERFPVLRALLEKGYGVTCATTPESASAGAKTILVGKFPENQAGTASAAPSLRYLRLDTADPAATVEAVEAARAEMAVPAPGSWKPWFPVIDFQRCTNCMQCLSFCLFDVYGVSADGKIQVQNQNNCKTDCPACSRVCPEVAIMFPKYRHGPINGDAVNDDDVRREAMKVDISSLLGGDIYAMLRDRSAKAKSRFSKERDDERALKERQNCLVKLQKDMDIPAEVFAALPSVEEIRAKAEAAKARAQEALASRERAVE